MGRNFLNTNVKLSFFKEKKNTIFYIFFSIIVILAAVVRFNGLEYPSFTEVHRDYLVSRHIVEFCVKVFAENNVKHEIVDTVYSGSFLSIYEAVKI